MAFLYSTTGIVLSRRDFKEADRFYSILTADHGKIECLARGGHKPLAKLTPHLEMSAEVELVIVYGRVFQTIAGVERKRRFVNEHPTLTQLLLIQNSLSLVDLATREHQQDMYLYQLVLSWLEFLQHVPHVSDERAAFILGAFTLKFLAILGYKPELSQCLSCHVRIKPGAFLWHALKGGVVCRTCAEISKEQWFAARPIYDETLKLVRFAFSESFENQLRPHLRAELIERFHEILESFLISHFPTIPAVSVRTACMTC